MILAMLVTTVVQPSGMTDEAWESLRARIESAPLAIAGFIERRTVCNDIRRDPRRDAALAASLRARFRCARVAADGRALYRAYRGRPQVLRLLRETEDLRGW